MSTEDAVVQAFKRLDEGLRNTFANLCSPMLEAFAVLKIARAQCGVSDLTSPRMSACLKAAGVSRRPVSIARALARAGDRVHRFRGDDGDVLYALMTAGEREIEPCLAVGNVHVLRCDGSRPRKDSMKLGKLLAALRGTVRVCDPYLGSRTLVTLDHLPDKCDVLFLTVNVDRKPALTHELKDFRSEKPKVEFRRVAKTEKLHDRYILTDDELFLVGHGIKDIGVKESFVVILDKRLAGDVMAEARSTFDKRWNQATPI